MDHVTNEEVFNKSRPMLILLDRLKRETNNFIYIILNVSNIICICFLKYMYIPSSDDSQINKTNGFTFT